MTAPNTNPTLDVEKHAFEVLYTWDIHNRPQLGYQHSGFTEIQVRNK